MLIDLPQVVDAALVVPHTLHHHIDPIRAALHLGRRLHLWLEGRQGPRNGVRGHSEVGGSRPVDAQLKLGLAQRDAGG